MAVSAAPVISRVAVASPKAAPRSWADIARGPAASISKGSGADARIEEAVADQRWDDVARRVASAFSSDVTEDDLDAGIPQVVQSALPGDEIEEVASELAVPKRPWCTDPVLSSAWQPNSIGSPLSTATEQTWRSVADCFVSALASESDDEGYDMSEVAPPQPRQALKHSAVPLRPSARGAKQCLCYGQVLIMLGHYGWLEVSNPIDHPAAGKHDGHIYVHRCDVQGGMTLVEGDHVVFYLYVDDHGLGAEDCRLQTWETRHARSAATTSAPRMNPQAAVFVPGVVSGGMMAPTPMPISRMASFKAPASTLNVFAVNDAYWSDDSSDEEECMATQVDEACDGDDDIDTLVVRKRLGLKASARRAPRKKASSHGSTSTGTPSDSESGLAEGPPPGLMHPAVRAPPGLSLP